MEIPEEWRPRPMVRVWGLPAAAQEEELAQLLEATLDGQGASVRSVVFDPRQTTAAGKVALVRFEPPPLPEEGAAEPDAGKVAEKLIAALRAAAPQLHGAKINVEKTGAEVGQASQLPAAVGTAVMHARLHAALVLLPPPRPAYSPARLARRHPHACTHTPCSPFSHPGRSASSCPTCREMPRATRACALRAPRTAPWSAAL